jgi:hypothetical protein
MTNIEDKLWEHLVEHHEADRAQLRTPTTSRTHRRRPVVVGIAATGVAAVGLASVLAMSSGSGTTAAGGPRVGRDVLSAPTGGAVTIEDTAYIVKRVKANIADGSQDGLVIESFSYAGSHLTSDGSVVDLGPKTFTQYYYTAPDGTVYMGNGGPGTAVLGPIVNGKRSVTETTIDNAKHTYSQTQTTEDYGSAAANARARPAVNLNSTSSEVLRALGDGQVTQLGTTTVNGTQAIALSVKDLRVPGRLIVDVDAQTYEPLRAVSTVTGNSSPPYISDWLPATPENIASAKGESIPAGYTKVGSSTGNAGSGNTGNTGNTGAG